MYKKLIEGKKAVFFDLDGTIVDTGHVWTLAIGAVLESIGINWVTDAHKYESGRDLVEQWNQLIKTYSINTEKDSVALTKATNEAFLNLLKDTELEVKEGFWPFVYEIKIEKHLKVALLTNSTKNIATEILRKIDAEKTFDLIICGDELKAPKPDPEIFKKGLEVLGLNPNEVLVFEDSLDGSKAASSIKLDTVIIWDGVHNQEKYKGNIRLFLPDFTPLLGNLELNYTEWIERTVEVLNEQSKQAKESKTEKSNAPTTNKF